MKWIRYIGHPALLMSLYLLLLIEGGHFGGFFLLYLLMSLSAGSLFAVVAVTGLLLVFVGYKIYRKELHPLKPLLYLAGYITMIVALVIFFERKERLETFELLIPTLTFVIFGISSICFLSNSVLMLLKSLSRNRAIIKVVV